MNHFKNHQARKIISKNNENFLFLFNQKLHHSLLGVGFTVLRRQQSGEKENKKG